MKTPNWSLQAHRHIMTSTLGVKRSNLSYEKVYEVVSRIPKGKVTTYGTIGKKLFMSPRVVGQALHLNPYEGEIPCHRVVNRDGRIAPGFAFGGLKAQRKLLETEGVNFKDQTHVDLKAHFCSFA